jgi:mitochondrial chaperone BCS1
MRQYIGYATEYQIYLMFLRFYPMSNIYKASAFAEKLISFKKDLSTAQIQGYFLLYKDEPDLAIQNADKLNTE